MSSYTITLQRVVENIVQNKTGKSKHDFESFDDLIKHSLEDIFEEYPIFDEDYREELNMKIIRHYYFRDLCVVPFQRWKFYINTHLKEIMPYYNQLYETALIKYDVFENVNVVETLDRDLSGIQIHKNVKDENVLDKRDEKVLSDKQDNLTTSQNQSGETTSNTKEVYEDTPYSALGNNDYATDITSETDKTVNTVNMGGNQHQNETSETKKEVDNLLETNSTSKNNSLNKNKEDYVKTLIGKNSAKSNAKTMLEFRETIINIDLMLIKELNENFGGFYN